MMNKKKKIDTSIFLDFTKPMSYNALLSFIITERGLGKSYGSKKFVAKHFLKTGKQFVYIRRYKTELREAMMKNGNPLFWSQIQEDEDLKGHKFTNKKDTMYIDEKLCGYAIPLSIANILKSASFNLVDTIIFDEFLIDKGNYHYLQNEVTQLLDVIETIGRLRDIRVIFLGNAISITNPYFNFFNLSLPYNSDVNIAKRDKNGNPLIIVYYARNHAYRDVKKESRFGQLIDGTEYGKYAIDNEFLRDSKTFIEKKSKDSKFLFILIINGNTYGVWIDREQSIMYLSNDYDKNCPTKFALMPDDHTTDTLMMKCHNNPFFKSLANYYQLGKLRFESIKIKNELIDILNKFSI